MWCLVLKGMGLVKVSLDLTDSMTDFRCGASLLTCRAKLKRNDSKDSDGLSPFGCVSDVVDIDDASRPNGIRRLDGGDARQQESDGPHSRSNIGVGFIGQHIPVQKQTPSDAPVHVGGGLVCVDLGGVDLCSLGDLWRTAIHAQLSGFDDAFLCRRLQFAGIQGNKGR